MKDSMKGLIWGAGLPVLFAYWGGAYELGAHGYHWAGMIWPWYLGRHLALVLLPIISNG